MRTSHWHANANELTYCLSGTSLVSVLDTGSVFSTFTVGAGEIFHIDSGSLHHIENIGDEVAEFSSPSGASAPRTSVSEPRSAR